MIKVSISGPMAVGKTTVIRKILESNPDYKVLFENAIANNNLFKSICTRENTLFARDFKQLIYINDILERQSKVTSDIILLDKGIEDILFFWKQSIT
jgi:deoxyadenosine/deoxycytidine kinase